MEEEEEEKEHEEVEKEKEEEEDIPGLRDCIAGGLARASNEAVNVEMEAGWVSPPVCWSQRPAPPPPDLFDRPLHHHHHLRHLVSRAPCTPPLWLCSPSP